MSLSGACSQVCDRPASTGRKTRPGTAPLREGVAPMATKLATTPDTTEKPEDPLDSPLLDSLGAGLKKLLQKGMERGYVTVDELSAALPAEEVTSEQIEDTMSMISEMGINLVDSAAESSSTVT